MSKPSPPDTRPDPSSDNLSHLKHVRTATAELPYDLEASKTISRGGKAVLQVIDAPFNGATPQVLKVLTWDDNIAEGMKTLPNHERRTARIIEVTVHSNFVITGLRDIRGPEKTRPVRDDLINFLQQTYMQPFEERRIFRWINDPVHVNDIGSIRSQWSQKLSGDDTHFYRLVNRTSLQQDPLDLHLRPRDSYLTCARDEDDRLIVIIVNDVSSTQTFRMSESHGDDIPFQNPRTISKIVAEQSCTSLSDDTLETFAKLLVLDFFLASIYLQPVDHYAPIIYPQLSDKEVFRYSLAKNAHLQVPLGLFEPRLSAKSKEAFKEIEDAEGILRSVNNLVDSIDFVMGALQKEKGGDAQGGALDERGRRMQELKDLCKERSRNAERALEALNRQLDYLTKRHSIREAKAIRILTILASLYLPLSLSTSILSMQTPFKAVAHTKTASEQAAGPNSQNLTGTNLLFDFFGVFITLATGTIFILYGIRFALWVKSHGLGILSKNFSGPYSIFYYGRRWRFGGNLGRAFDYIRKFSAAWIGAGFGITLLTIFMVGMLRGAQDAWTTAKWLFVAYCISSGCSLVACVGMYCHLHYKELRSR